MMRRGVVYMRWIVSRAGPYRYILFRIVLPFELLRSVFNALRIVLPLELLRPVLNALRTALPFQLLRSVFNDLKATV